MSLKDDIKEINDIRRRAGMPEITEGAMEWLSGFGDQGTWDKTQQDDDTLRAAIDEFFGNINTTLDNLINYYVTKAQSRFTNKKKLNNAVLNQAFDLIRLAEEGVYDFIYDESFEGDESFDDEDEYKGDSTDASWDYIEQNQNHITKRVNEFVDTYGLKALYNK